MARAGLDNFLLLVLLCDSFLFFSTRQERWDMGDVDNGFSGSGALVSLYAGLFMMDGWCYERHGRNG
jgi:hypothetical protein